MIALGGYIFAWGPWILTAMGSLWAYVDFKYGSVALLAGVWLLVGLLNLRDKIRVKIDSNKSGSTDSLQNVEQIEKLESKCMEFAEKYLREVMKGRAKSSIAHYLTMLSYHPTSLEKFLEWRSNAVRRFSESLNEEVIAKFESITDGTDTNTLKDHVTRCRVFLTDLEKNISSDDVIVGHIYI